MEWQMLIIIHFCLIEVNYKIHKCGDTAEAQRQWLPKDDCIKAHLFLIFLDAHFIQLTTVNLAVLQHGWFKGKAYVVYLKCWNFPFQ